MEAPILFLNTNCPLTIQALFMNSFLFKVLLVVYGGMGLYSMRCLAYKGGGTMRDACMAVSFGPKDDARSSREVLMLAPCFVSCVECCSQGDVKCNERESQIHFDFCLSGCDWKNGVPGKPNTVVKVMLMTSCGGPPVA